MPTRDWASELNKLPATEYHKFINDNYEHLDDILDSVFAPDTIKKGLVDNALFSIYQYYFGGFGGTGAGKSDFHSAEGIVKRLMAFPPRHRFLHHSDPISLFVRKFLPFVLDPTMVEGAALNGYIPTQDAILHPSITPKAAAQLIKSTIHKAVISTNTSATNYDSFGYSISDLFRTPKVYQSISDLFRTPKVYQKVLQDPDAVSEWANSDNADMQLAAVDSPHITDDDLYHVISRPLPPKLDTFSEKEMKIEGWRNVRTRAIGEALKRSNTPGLIGPKTQAYIAHLPIDVLTDLTRDPYTSTHAFSLIKPRWKEYVDYLTTNTPRHHMVAFRDLLSGDFEQIGADPLYVLQKMLQSKSEHGDDLTAWMMHGSKLLQSIDPNVPGEPGTNRYKATMLILGDAMSVVPESTMAALAKSPHIKPRELFDLYDESPKAAKSIPPDFLERITEDPEIVQIIAKSILPQFRAAAIPKLSNEEVLKAIHDDSADVSRKAVGEAVLRGTGGNDEINPSGKSPPWAKSTPGDPKLLQDTLEQIVTHPHPGKAAWALDTFRNDYTDTISKTDEDDIYQPYLHWSEELKDGFAKAFQQVLRRRPGTSKQGSYWGSVNNILQEQRFSGQHLHDIYSTIEGMDSDGLVAPSVTAKMQTTLLSNAPATGAIATVPLIRKHLEKIKDMPAFQGPTNTYDEDGDSSTGKLFRKLADLDPEGPEAGMQQASDFWLEYERHVRPSHFAAVKHAISGLPLSEPVQVQHRGAIESSLTHIQAVPHLHDYAKATQRRVLQEAFDPESEVRGHFDYGDHHHHHDLKGAAIRFYKGKPYLRVLRGLNGDYAKSIADAAGMDDNTRVDDRYLKLPMLPFSSWTTDPRTALSFASGRKIKGQALKAIVLEKWLPLDHLMHVGFLDVHPGHEHAHMGEKELIFKHPKGHILIHSTNIHIPKGYDSMDRAKLKTPAYDAEDRKNEPGPKPQSPENETPEDGDIKF